jgi:hypothetical protein
MQVLGLGSVRCFPPQVCQHGACARACLQGALRARACPPRIRRKQGVSGHTPTMTAPHHTQHYRPQALSYTVHNRGKQRFPSLRVFAPVVGRGKAYYEVTIRRVCMCLFMHMHARASARPNDSSQCTACHVDSHSAQRACNRPNRSGPPAACKWGGPGPTTHPAASSWASETTTSANAASVPIHHDAGVQTNIPNPSTEVTTLTRSCVYVYVCVCVCVCCAQVMGLRWAEADEVARPFACAAPLRGRRIAVHVSTTEHMQTYILNLYTYMTHTHAHTHTQARAELRARLGVGPGRHGGVPAGHGRGRHALHLQREGPGGGLQEVGALLQQSGGGLEDLTGFRT